ncbi:MAG: hypothetical protein ACRYF2_12685, partial [Janthinobacterium lividum]
VVRRNSCRQNTRLTLRRTPSSLTADHRIRHQHHCWVDPYLGLAKQPTRYPTLPDVRRFRPARFVPAAAPAAPTSAPRRRQAA